MSSGITTPFAKPSTHVAPHLTIKDQNDNEEKQQVKEIRIGTAPQKFEVRKNADGSRSIGGYAATFNDLSQDLSGFKEKIAPGVFKQSLKDNPDVLCLYGHDDNQILGRGSSGTLEISEDSKGLKFTCKLPDTSTARDLIALMERDDIRSMSFGFYCIEDDWNEVNGQAIRTLIQVVLFEISVVGMPAYESSSVSLRSAPKAIRAKLIAARKKDTIDAILDEPDDDDSDNDDADECECDCENCQAGDCEQCSNPDCDDENCLDCPEQTRAAHLELIARRLR